MTDPNRKENKMESQTVTPMPRYKCHKEVWALKIKSIEYEHMPRFQGATCRGAFGLGTACGSCEKCKWEQETGGKLGLIITPEESGFAPFKVSHEYAHKHKPLVGGYFVQYSDGYKSFSPAEAFEEGYALLSGPRTAFESNMLADLSDDQIIQRHGNCSHLGWQEDARTFSEELAKRLRERESEVKRLRQELGQEIKANAQIPPVLQQIAEATGGTIESISGPLSDGSGFAVMSMPLSKSHWIYADHENEPPATFSLRDGDTHIMFITGKMSTDGSDAGFDSQRGMTITRKAFAALIREAGRYAIRTSTGNGKEMDFDPDAMLINLVMGFLGQHDGTLPGELAEIKKEGVQP